MFWLLGSVSDTISLLEMSCSEILFHRQRTPLIFYLIQFDLYVRVIYIASFQPVFACLYMYRLIVDMCAIQPKLRDFLCWDYSLNSNLADSLGGITFGVDDEGNYGYIKAGADTVTPFKTGGGPITLYAQLYTYANGGTHVDHAYYTIPCAGYKKLTVKSITSAGNGGYPKNYDISINDLTNANNYITLTNGKVVDISGYDTLKLYLDIHETAAQYVNFGMAITYELT